MPNPNRIEAGFFLNRVFITVFLRQFQQNKTVETLDLEDNGLEGEGAVFVADMLKENQFIAKVVRNKFLTHYEKQKKRPTY